MHWCSQQRGHPGNPARDSTALTIWKGVSPRQGCAPLCTVGCVHRVAQVDELREDPQRTLSQWFASPVPGQPPRFPLPVKVLMWVFVTSSGRGLFRKAVAGASGGDRRLSAGGR